MPKSNKKNGLRLQASRGQATQFESPLYRHPLRSTRTGPLFSAFPYPTKVSPEAIALFIASHTAPGATIFDGFAGSGTTGVAALLCAHPTEPMLAEAKRLGLKVRWGARKAVLYDIGVLGTTISRTLCNPPNVPKFREAAERLLSEVEGELSWMYEARDPDGVLGTLRYVVWSDVVECPNCGKHVTLWDGCVRRKPASVNAKLRCPYCARSTPATDARRILKTTFDEVLGRKVTGRERRPVWVYGSTGKKNWSRPVNASDRVLFTKIAEVPLPGDIPKVEIPWGDLYRSGYHAGITHLHHFYTRRNLAIFATLWSRASSFELKEALRFLLLSYNASHATLMTRVVAKQNQNDLVVTSAQPGVLYVSGLPVEKNLFDGIRRKLGTISAAFALTAGGGKYVKVHQGSSTATDLPDQSIDYVFTDPPFGGNIPYAEVNFVNEAWLGELTDSTKEITISRAQEKACSDYEALMRDAFAEIRRTLKPKGKATVVFHSASSAVWNALHRAYEDSGLRVEASSVLDKTQGSFKQVTTGGAVKGDPVLLLSCDPTRKDLLKSSTSAIVRGLIRAAEASSDVSERTAQRLYSRFVGHHLLRNEDVPMDADRFYALVADRLDTKHARPTD